MVTMGNGPCFANVCDFASAKEKQKRENRNVFEIILEIVLACCSPGLIGGEKLICHSWPQVNRCLSINDKPQTICCSQRLERKLTGLLTQ